MNKSFVWALVLALVVMATMTQALTLSARALKDEIINLPGAPKDLPFRHFSGYIDVEDEVGKASIFYWLVLAIKVDPATAPLTWWTNGGPGCSGLIGKLTENGPFQPQKDGTLALREFPWNDYSNIVFVEQPDVGFTNIHSHRGGAWNNEIVAERNSIFIKNFFERYPEFKKNPFFISSESMGGHYLPTLSNVLIRKEKELNIDYRGLFVGNPLIYMSFRDFGFARTLIDRQLVPFYPYGKAFIEKCIPDVNAPHVNPPVPPPSECWELEMQIRSYARKIDLYAMSFPKCVGDNGEVRSSLGEYGEHIARYFGKASRAYRGYSILEDFFTSSDDEVDNSIDLTPNDDVLTGLAGLGDLSQADELKGYFPTNYQPCEDSYATRFLNKPEVQDALHVQGKRSWSMCKNISYSQTSMNDSMIKFYKDNHQRSNGRVKSVIFSGNDDTMCSTIEAQMALFNGNLTMHSNPWRDVTLNGQLIGHRTDFDEVSFVTINSAGHMAPSTRPEHTYSLYNSFISGKWFN